MNRPSCAVPFLALLLASPALADPLFNFTITGDGHTFQFTVPSPPVTTENPHLVYAQLPTTSGTVDGVGGYTFRGDLVVLGNNGFFPVLDLDVSPDPTGIKPPYPTGTDTYMLNGPTFTTLVSDVPNPYPSCPLGVCNDLLSFAFVPAEYTLYGYDPDRNQGPYTLDITAATPATVTPEPPTFLLMLAGIAGSGVAAFRRRRSRAGGAPGRFHRAPRLT